MNPHIRTEFTFAGLMSAGFLDAARQAAAAPLSEPFPEPAPKGEPA